MKSLCLAAFLFCGLWVTAAWCQDALPKVTTSSSPVVRSVEPLNVSGQTLFAGPALLSGQRTSGKAAEAYQKIKDAESDDDRDAAIDELRAALEEEYEARLDDYEQHLADLQEKIKELTKQLDRRRDAKSEMVELRLKMMIHEADGLGWPEANSFGGFFRPAAPFASPPGTPTSPRNPLHPGGVR